MSLTVETASGGGRKTVVYGAVAAAVLICIAAVGVPAGWYGKKQPASVPQPTAAAAEPQLTNNAGLTPTDTAAGSTVESSPEQTDVTGAASGNDSTALAARREREARDRERAKAADAASAKSGSSTAATPAPAEAAKKPEPAKPKSTSVQVTYDEAGRVTGASGGDANALRIARQKRFPAGKAGSATVTIPVN